MTILAAACAAGGASAAHADGIIPQAFTTVWKKASTVSYQAPSANDAEAARGLFERLLKGERGDPLRRQAAQLGWEMRSEKSAGTDWTVLVEPASERAGRGMYAFSDKGRHALQAPHVPSDGLTGDILVRFAGDGLPRALAWNTVHRKQADLAHLDYTYFNAFALAYARAFPNERIFQLHGFDSDRRKSGAGADSAAIISATIDRPPPALREAVSCLKKRVAEKTRLYGVDVRELGGTTNSGAKALRQAGYADFVHIELDRDLRERLLNSAADRQAFFECLGGSDR